MRRLRGDRGAVTAEIALALPAVVLVLLVVLAVGAAGIAQLRATDGARVAARAVTAGYDDAEAAAQARAVAGEGASVAVVRDGEWVRVTVRRPLGASWTPAAGLRASATAVARVEP